MSNEKSFNTQQRSEHNVIKPPKKETVLAERCAIELRQYLKFEKGEQFAEVVKIIYNNTIKIYGRTN